MNTKLLKSVFVATAVLGASVGFATDYTLTQSGKWSDPATWGLTAGYPNSTSDTITIPSSIADAVTIDLEGNSYSLLSFTQASSHIVTLKNGTISADTSAGHLYINAANGGLAFEDNFTYTGYRIWPHNLSTSAATSMSFKNGTFNGTFSLSGFYGAGTFTLTADNAIVKHTQTTSALNTLSATIVFDVKLGENNVAGDADAAIQFLTKGYSANSDNKITLTVDCSGKSAGTYAIIKDEAKSKYISALATNGKATASNVGGLTAAFSWDSDEKTLYLTLSEAPVTHPELFYGKGGTGNWTDTAMWTVDEGGLGYPSKEGDKVYFNTVKTTSAIDLNLQGTTYAIDVIENTAANPVVIKNGTLTITTGSASILNSGSLTFKDATVNLKTSADGCVENVANNAVLGFEGDNTLNCFRFRGSSTVGNALSIINVTNGATAINAMYIQRGSGNFRFNVGNATLTMNGSEQVSFLQAAMAFNLTLGGNNTTSSDAMIKMVCSKTFTIQAAPTLTVNATGKGAGSYKLITIPANNTYVSALAGAQATVDDGKTGTVKWDAESFTLYLEITEGKIDDRPVDSYIVKQSGNWNLESTWYHNSAQTYPGANGTAIASPETPSDAVVNIHSSEAGDIDAKSIVVSNDCSVTFKGTVPGAYFRLRAGQDTTGASGFLVQKGAKVTLDSVQCGNNYSSFYIWLNGSAELALVGNATLGGYLIRPNGNATDGYPTLSFKDGAAKWLFANGAFQNATALTFKFDNATLTSNKGFNMLASKATWNIKMGAKNTTDTAVFTATSGTIQSSTRPAFIIDMTGKKSGTYPIISAALGGQYQQVTNSDFTVTCDVKCRFSVVTDKDTGISLNFEKAQGLAVILR